MPTSDTDVTIDPANLDPSGAMTGPIINAGNTGFANTVRIMDAGTIVLIVNPSGGALLRVDHP